jgi:hypothetical protein
MNREIFPSGGLLQLKRKSTEMVCVESLRAERPVMKDAL